MQVKDLMSIHIYTVYPEDSAEAAAEIMRREDVGAVPVCDKQNHLLGMITDRDLLIRRAAGKTAEVVMTPSPFAIPAKMDIHEAALEFSRRGVRRLPVVENGRLTGMLTLKDLARKKIFAAEIGHILYSICNNENQTTFPR